MDSRPPESEARAVIGGMLALTVVIVILVVAINMSVTARSTILIAWIAVMMAVLRSYRL